MLQYALKFESVLFTFTIIYITFLFSLGPLPLSSHLLFPPSVSSFLHQIVFALSLTSFLCSLSLLHVTASLSDETQAKASSHATPHEPDLHFQIAVHQHNHTNSTHHIHNNPWLDQRHTTSPSMSCHPPRHQNFPPSDFSPSACSGGFCFWVCLIWDVGLFDLSCRSLWAFFFLFFFILRWRWWMWVYAGGGCRCCCGSGGCAVVVVDDDEDDRE